MKLQNVFILIFSLCAVALIGIFLKRSQPIKDESVLLVGTSYDYPPYTFMENNQIVGFDIDLITQIAARMNKKVTIVDVPFSGLIFGLLSGTIDVLASAMSPTSRRKKFVLFSQNYLSGDPLVIVSKKTRGNFDSLDGLQGKSVVVNTGFVADTYMSDKQGVSLVRLKTPAEALMAIQSGAHDAWVCAQSSAQAFLSKVKNPETYAVIPLVGTGDDYAFVTSKNNEQLMNQINIALQACGTDGTLDALKEKWKLS